MPKCYLCLTNNYKYMMKTELNTGWWVLLPNVFGQLVQYGTKMCKRQTNISFLLVPIAKLQDMVWKCANIVRGSPKAWLG